jgi:hypothetical protein
MFLLALFDLTDCQLNAAYSPPISVHNFFSSIVPVVQKGANMKSVKKAANIIY